MSDLISTQELVAKIVDTATRKILSGEQELTKEYEQSVKEVVNEILDTARRERGNAEAQAEIVRCKDCKHHWTHRCMDSMPTEICDLNQTFYDPNIDFCSLAERRTDGSD